MFGFNALTLKIIAGLSLVVLVLGGVLYIQHVTGENERLTMERDAALASEADALKTLSALKQAAIERTADNTRIDAAEKGLRDDLDRIERAIDKGEPVAPDAAAIAVTCARMRRAGQTTSAAYKRRC